MSECPPLLRAVVSCTIMTLAISQLLKLISPMHFVRKCHVDRLSSNLFSLTDIPAFMNPGTVISVTFLFVMSTLLSTVKAQAADNGILGTPRVTCEENRLMLDVETKQPFFGHVFVKGKYKDDQCSQRFNDTSRRGAYFMVQLGRCGMQRLRSASPRGMSFVITVIVSFHPLFITRTDRAYHVRCFYVEPDELVSTQLEVSMIPTTIVQDSMAMPTCTYTVRLDSPDGKVVNFANVGDRVYHVWDCKGPDMGILVKKCFVNNGENQEVAVLDYNGCSSDANLLSELTYDPSLMKAHAQSHVFKYADQNGLFFACQIRMCQKKLGSCEGVTPPKCSSTADPLKMHRMKREVDLDNTVHIYPGSNGGNSNATTRDHNTHKMTDGVSYPEEIDVITEEIMVLDLDKRAANPGSNDSLQDRHENGTIRLGFTEIEQLPISDQQMTVAATPTSEGLLCVSTPVVVVFVGMSFLMVVFSALISAFVCRTAAAARTKLGQFLAPSRSSDSTASTYSLRPPSKSSLAGGSLQEA